MTATTQLNYLKYHKRLVKFSYKHSILTRSIQYFQQFSLNQIGNCTRIVQVTLYKRSSGDFGLSLRRSAVVEYSQGQAITRNVFFAEPGLFITKISRK